MKDNIFECDINIIYDLQISSSANRIKVWTQKRQIGFELHFREGNLNFLENLIDQDRPKDKHYLELAGPPTPIPDLENYYRALANINDIYELLPIIHRQNDPVGTQLRWFASKYFDRYGNVPILNFISCRLWNNGRLVEMRNGRIWGKQSMTCQFTSGNTYKF